MARSVWDRFGSRLMQVARRKLGNGFSGRVADEEDVVISAFNSFCARVAAGKIEMTDDEEDLWPLLKVITERKAIDYFQRERRQKRGGGQVRGESALDGGSKSPRAGGVGEVPAGDRSPSSMARAAEMFEQLLDVLDDDMLRVIAIFKMEGRTNPEIAEIFCISRATVVRKLEVIRTVWEAQLQDEQSGA
ncbi:MAG: RNA polymerase subunit sigma-70 [Planctomycetes bacterium]|nr:RNA polymerase subunit sigma-70 [Planctomycetota bacterium]MBL7038499.1 RNA polymerase subunit sigma-70 [Pirellulaceae bacterium]